MKNALHNIIGTVLLSFIGLVVEYGLARIPYIGPVCAIIVAFFLGYGLGWVILPWWSSAFTTVWTLGGVFLAASHQFKFVQGSQVVAGIITAVSAGLFFWGFARGCARDQREAKRDIDGKTS